MTDYAALVQLEYEKYDSGHIMGGNHKNILSEVKDTIAMQSQIMNMLGESLGSINTSIQEGNKSIVDRLNQPKNIIRDNSGKIKGVI